MKEHKCQGCQSCQGSNGHGCSCESKGYSSGDCSCDNCDNCNDCKDCDDCECGHKNQTKDKRIEEVKKIIQEWTDKQGHERCWYYPDLFNQLIKTLDIKPSKEPNLPPLEEFKCGCEKYQCEEYHLDVKSTITEEKLLKYKTLTSDALRIAKSSIVKGKEEQAKEIIDMVSNYISDAEHFESEKDFVNSFAALNYAHGWIDSGVRLEIFDVTDDKLFTVK